MADLARQRALLMFSKLGVWDTADNNGVLIYLLLAEHKIELVADRGVNAVVGPAILASPSKERSFRAVRAYSSKKSCWLPLKKPKAVKSGSFQTSSSTMGWPRSRQCRHAASMQVLQPASGGMSPGLALSTLGV